MGGGPIKSAEAREITNKWELAGFGGVLPHQSPNRKESLFRLLSVFSSG
jgi:hypothetical protein